MPRVRIHQLISFFFEVIFVILISSASIYHETDIQTIQKLIHSLSTMAFVTSVPCSLRHAKTLNNITPVHKHYTCVSLKRQIISATVTTTTTTTTTTITDNSASAPSVSLVSLGCPKNVTDAEVMLGDLSSQGIRILPSSDSDDADVVVINTCGFVEDAKRESLDAILNAARDKEKSEGRRKGIIVTGCLAQRYADELAKELPELDAVIGFEHYGELASHVTHLVNGKQSEKKQQIVRVGGTSVPFRPEHERIRLGPSHSVYVRLAEGCSHSCTFCAIPGQFRGSFRSKSWNAVTQEISTLAKRGAQELIFIAEDTNQYGMDFGREETNHRLSDLLYYVDKHITSVKWMRLLYCYPSYFTDALIDAIANLKTVCKYIDMPLQHISDRVLKRMNRPSKTYTLNLLEKLRTRIPNLIIRTTFITGFPGETEEDHMELVQFIQNQRFQHAGFFIYSEEEGTPAAEFENQIPLDVREYRKDELTAIQQQIQEEIAQSYVGKVLDVIIDRIEDGHSIGRTANDAPDIDGHVHVLQKLPVGEIVKIHILGTSSFDLYGEPVKIETL